MIPSREPATDRPQRPASMADPLEPGALPDWLGKLVWLREPPLIGCVVRVVHVRRQKGWVYADLEVQASVVLREECAYPAGKRISVGTPTRDGYPLFRIHPLEAEDVDAAIREVDACHAHRVLRWRR